MTTENIIPISDENSIHSKRNILFYGDSNTWGFDPQTLGRYPYDQRWTTICSTILGDSFHCIPEGMNGRTTIFDDLYKGCRNGLAGLDYALQTHKPIDMVVVMLGTNDLKLTNADGSAEGMEKIVREIISVNDRFPDSFPVFIRQPRILLISPIVISTPFIDNMICDEVAESHRFAPLYRKIAEKHSLFFMDAAEIAEPSETDGVHLSPEGHTLLGKAVAQKIKGILGSAD